MKHDVVKKIKLLFTILISVTLIVYLTTNLVKYVSSYKHGEVTTPGLGKINIAIIFTGSGLGDKSYNDLTYDGVLKSHENLGIQFDYSEIKLVKDYEKELRKFASVGNYNLIIAIGPELEEAIINVSKDFPNQRFTILDSKLKHPNVSAISTKWAEQTFLNGVIAGMLMKEKELSLTHKAGVILGMDVPHLRQGAIGFEAGVKYIDSKREVLVATIGDFNDPLKAREISLLMYNKGTDYIQHLAGASGLGVFTAAKEVDKYAFGVDANQNFFQPDNIVATSLREINKIVYEEIKSIKENTWSDGIQTFGITEKIIDITRDGSNVPVSDEIMITVESIKRDIISQKLVIPNTKDELDEWLKFNKY